VLAREIHQDAFRSCEQVVDIHGEQAVRHGGGVYSISQQRLLDIHVGRAKDLGADIEFGHEVKSLAELPEADLIVACYGVNSRMRLEVGGFQTDEHVGRNKYLWLGTSKVFGEFAYHFVSTDVDWIWAYAYRVDAGQSTLIVECPPQTWVGLGLDALSLQDGICVLGMVFERPWTYPLLGQFQHGVGAGWLNFRTVTNRRWHVGNIVLAGDVAHATHYTMVGHDTGSPGRHCPSRQPQAAWRSGVVARIV
jgi:2-polyprenyl-6-methoxyphenol hydroxylase-like FAD-dependent oxidoreductase